MKKKLLLLSLLMALCVGLALPAWGETAPHTHCLCGNATHAEVDNCDKTTIEWTEWTDELAQEQNGEGNTAENSLPTTSGNYVLQNDVNLSATWTPTGDVNLCLQNHSICVSCEKFLEVKNGVTVTVTSCGSGENAVIHGDNESYFGVFVYEGGTFRMYNGTITGFTQSGIYVDDGGSLYLYGGKITGNTAYSDGAGVHFEGDMFEVGGTVNITNNTVTVGGANNVFLAVNDDNVMCPITVAEGGLSEDSTIYVYPNALNGEKIITGAVFSENNTVFISENVRYIITKYGYYADGESCNKYNKDHTSNPENTECMVCGEKYCVKAVDSNGTTKYWTDGDYGSVGKAFEVLAESGGTITLMGDGKTESVTVTSNVTFDLNGHNVLPTLENQTFALILENGGSLTVHNSGEKVGDFHFDITIEGGTLNVGDDVIISKVIFRNDSSTKLYAGTYKAFEVNTSDNPNKTIINYIADGYAIFKGDTVVNANVTALTDGDYTIKSHTCGNYSNGVCECGRRCPTFHNFEGLTEENGYVCPTCGQKFVAISSWDNKQKFCTTLQEAVQAISGTATITLLNDCTFDGELRIGTSDAYDNRITLDGQGHNINGNIFASGSFVLSNVKYVQKFQIANVSAVMVAENIIKFGEFTNYSAGSILPSGYILTDESGNYVAIKQGETLCNVTVTKCPHTEPNGQGTCPNCGYSLVAEVTNGENTTFYHNLNDAISALRDGDTLKLLQDVTGYTNFWVTGGTTVTLDLNGHNFDSYTVYVKNNTTSDGDLCLRIVGNGNVKALLVDTSVKVQLCGGTYGSYALNYSGDVRSTLEIPDGYGCYYTDNNVKHWYDKDSTEEIPTNKTLTATKLPIQNLKVERDKDTPLYWWEHYTLTASFEYVENGIDYDHTASYLWTTSEDVRSDTMDNESVTAKKDKAGKAVWECTVTVDGYSKTVSYEVDVQKRTLTVTPPKGYPFISYNGEPQALLCGSVDVEGLYGGRYPTILYRVDGGTWTTDAYEGVNATDAGTHIVEWYVAEDDYYKGYGTEENPYSLQVVIDPMLISFEVADGLISKVYDGTVDFSEELWDNVYNEITFAGSDGAVSLIPHTDFEITSVEFVVPNVQERMSGTIELVLKNKNYTLSDDFNGFFEGQITKATPPETELTTTLTVKNGYEHQYTIDLTELLPALPDGCEWGDMEYNGNITVDVEGVNAYNNGMDDLLYIDMDLIDSEEEGDFGTITVEIESWNYEPITATVKLVTENRVKPTGAPVLSKSYLTYGETLEDISLSGTLTDGDNAVTGTFLWWSISEEPPEVQEEYTAEWVFYPDDLFTYAPVVGTVTLAVRQPAPSAYTVTVSEVEGGTASVSAERVKAGTDVTVTATPDAGYVIDSVSVRTKWSVVEVTDNGDGTFTFTQPAGSVTVKPVFKKIAEDKPTNPDSGNDNQPTNPDNGNNNKPTNPTDKREWKDNFSDVTEENWFYDAVKSAYESGLMSGRTETSFMPEATATREQFVTVLWRMAGSPKAEVTAVFTDVDVNEYYAEAVCWAVQNKIVNGYDDGRFGVYDEITREQLATMLYRYEKSIGGGFTGAWAFRVNFTDVANVSEWAWEAICWCNMKGIVNGRDDGSLDPQGIANRAEMATIFTAYLNLER